MGTYTIITSFVITANMDKDKFTLFLQISNKIILICQKNFETMYGKLEGKPMAMGELKNRYNMGIESNMLRNAPISYATKRTLTAF